MVLLQEGEYLVEICCQMNKEIRFNKIIIFRQHYIGQWPIQCWLISFMFFIIFHGETKSLLQEKEYNWAISHQIKKEIYLISIISLFGQHCIFSLRLTITHFVFYVFGLPSSAESEENPPSRMNTQLIH